MSTMSPNSIDNSTNSENKQTTMAIFSSTDYTSKITTLENKPTTQAVTDEEKATDVSVSKGTMDLDDSVLSLQGVSAKVHIDTLSPYTGFGGGIYTMAVVKKMTATEDFLGMPLKDRRCEVESFEDCRTKKLLEACNCVPWEVSQYQVGVVSKEILSTLSTSEP